MADDNNSLDDLLQGVKRSKESGAGAKSTSKKALSPLELLALPDNQRKVVNYLSHQKQSSLDDVQQNLPDFSTTELEQTLYALKEAGYIREALIDGEIYYRVVFGGSARSKIFLPAGIWDRLNLDSVTFLQQMPMFKGLSRHELRAISKQMEERQYRRNEVIVWQGEISDDAFLIKNGIVGISHLSTDRKTSQTLAYLRQGDILGEIGVLQNQVRSATATALSNIDVLVIKREQFLRLLEKYDTAAIELARMLGRQLVATSARLGQQEAGTNLVLVFRVASGTGGTTIAGALASAFARQTRRDTVYTEYPNPQLLPQRFGFEPDKDVYHHPAGYDIRLPKTDPALPDDVDATLLIDYFFSYYANIVIGLPDKIDEGVVYMLARASQIILVSPPEEQAWEVQKKLRAAIKKHIHSDRTSILSVINRPEARYQDIPAPEPVDFDLPYLADLADQTEEAYPVALNNLAEAIVDQLGRTSEIALYIPTTIDVDQSIDTTPYVKDALAFMGEYFGGATSNQAEGVWDSEEAGLVNEVVYIVRSFVTQEEMNEHLDTVLAYIAKMKEELQQEAMAVEVDRKLMLV